MALRIGQLVVVGDRNTVFGGLDRESEALPAEYRSHGGFSETKVPLLAFNAEGAPGAEYFQRNLDVAWWVVTA